MEPVAFDYTRQDAAGASCTAQAWAQVPDPVNPTQALALKDRKSVV